MGKKEIKETFENSTLADLLDELELASKENYPEEIKQMLLEEIENRK